ncbi:Protein cms1 [Malassezia caprae]|uniref:Protein cms1 n=1 Tax=Malassezia caprae TaxID=1381934 RepID=A0AAF0IUF0_9BASI|nr:Protein cms1 [Malassezia caprae]
MADELDDGLLLEDELVAYSDDAASDAEARAKRPAPPSTDDAAAAKKRKRREQAKAQRRKKAAKLQEQASAAQKIAQQPRDLQADFLVGLQRKAFPKLSELELQELRVPVVARHDELQDTKQPWMTEPGTPYLLVLTGNAQRAADLTRALRVLLPGTDEPPAKRRKGASSPAPTVAKLFARHFKLEEQVSWLKSQPAPIAVGTPHRVQALLEQRALRIEHLQAVLVDASWTDAKQRAVFDTPETRDALLALLAESSVRVLLQKPSDPCRVVLY